MTPLSRRNGNPIRHPPSPRQPSQQPFVHFSNKVARRHRVFIARPECRGAKRARAPSRGPPPGLRRFLEEEEPLEWCRALITGDARTDIDRYYSLYLSLSLSLRSYYTCSVSQFPGNLGATSQVGAARRARGLACAFGVRIFLAIAGPVARQTVGPESRSSPCQRCLPTFPRSCVHTRAPPVLY